jgi:hypothetical protein
MVLSLQVPFPSLVLLNVLVDLLQHVLLQIPQLLNALGVAVVELVQSPLQLLLSLQVLGLYLHQFDITVLIHLLFVQQFLGEQLDGSFTVDLSLEAGRVGRDGAVVEILLVFGDVVGEFVTDEALLRFDLLDGVKQGLRRLGMLHDIR